SKPARFPGDRELKFAFDHVDHLFVGMRVLGKERARLNLPMRKGHVGRMHEMDFETGKDFPQRLVVELDKGHRLQLPSIDVLILIRHLISRVRVKVRVRARSGHLSSAIRKRTFSPGPRCKVKRFTKQSDTE